MLYLVSAYVESGSSIRSPVICPSCLWLMLCTVGAAVLNGFKMFFLGLGRFVFVPWCVVDHFPLMDLVRRNWVESGYVDMAGSFWG